ncbi:hypothetical protein NE237_017859 [Protea cynaroides]|uniref:Uncharacterized protein n=1 Tax=Protea cynaroides TaxID=273540 RepID=A0A9Q0QND6_9MAGN|nr:hypothetical protein NE237_017859 [Protea cynaroides]
MKFLDIHGFCYYTEHTLKTLTINSKTRHHVQHVGAESHQLNIICREESERCRIACKNVNVDSCLVLSLDGKTEEQEDSSFIDALAVAISRVRMREADYVVPTFRYSRNVPLT